MKSAFYGRIGVFGQILRKKAKLFIKYPPNIVLDNNSVAPLATCCFLFAKWVAHYFKKDHKNQRTISFALLHLEFQNVRNRLQKLKLVKSFSPTQCPPTQKVL